jgi:hypothetical protein
VLPDTARWLLRLVQAEQPFPDDVPADLWPALLEAAREAEVQGLVAERVLSQGTRVPPGVGRELTALRLHEARHHGFHFVEAERIAGVLGARGIRWVLLKGAGLARTAYDAPVERAFRDLDVLVDAARHDEAIAALRALGYADADPAPVQAVQRATHFHVALAGLGKPRVEVHWAVVRPEDPYQIDPRWLLEGAVVPAETPRVPCPPAEAQVVHAAANQVRCGFTQLKRIVDVDRIARRGGVDWARVAELASVGGLAPAVRLLLELSFELLGTPLDEPLARMPQLGPVRARLDELGIAGFPLGLPPSAWGPARHVVRYWLARDRGVVVHQFVFPTPFERERMRALGVGRGAELAGTAKRTLILAWLALWQLGLRVVPHRRSLSLRPDG